MLFFFLYFVIAKVITDIYLFILSFSSSFIDTKLVPDDDPENVKHEFAFDNLAFKGK